MSLSVILLEGAMSCEVEAVTGASLAMPCVLLTPAASETMTFAELCVTGDL